ncbi:hypothetical protein GXW78_07565 [Roseomonas terrae]|uniref:LamG domain-containing protein n=1 Tax=Neoroseomonas terrae TaxID=424799 RepID=A0ABS5EFQ6_9PROT|nr:hypothetical protein [Neoroseomonas terrae]MBR0649512.1 hypothetical protein [Neoroseomonas terrae]
MPARRMRAGSPYAIPTELRGVNRQHPLADRLRSLYFPGALGGQRRLYNLAPEPGGPYIEPQSAVPQVITGAFGPCSLHNSAGGMFQAQRATWAPPSLQTDLAPATIFAMAIVDGAPAGGQYPAIYSMTGAAGITYLAFAPTASQVFFSIGRRSNGGVEFALGNWAAGNVLLMVGATDGVTQHAGYILNLSTGVLSAGSSGTSTAFGGTTEQDAFENIGGADYGTDYFLTGRVFAAGMASRQWSDGEMRAFLADPWDLLQRPVWRSVARGIPADGPGEIAGEAILSDGPDVVSSAAAALISGAVAGVDSADAASVAGTVRVAGGAALNDSSDGAQAAGTVAIAGAAGVTDGTDQAAASGTVSVTGVASLADGPDVVSATGGAEGGITGSAALVDSADSVQAAGVVRVGGTAALSDGADAVTGAAVVLIAGAAAVADGPDSVTASGGLGNVIQGAMALVDGNDTATASGTVSIAGAAALQDGADAVASAAGIRITGAAVLLDLADGIAAGGALAIRGAAALTDGGDAVLALGIVTTGSPIAVDPRRTVLLGRRFQPALPPPVIPQLQRRERVAV